MIPAETYQRIVLVIEGVRKGDTLTEACRKIGMAPFTVRSNVAQVPELQAMLEEAYDVSHDIIADKLLNIDNEVSDPKMAAVISKNYQWWLARKRPERYGDRMIIENVGGVDKEIVELMRAAVDRIPIPPPPAAIEALPMIDITPVAEDDAHLMREMGLL